MEQQWEHKIKKAYLEKDKSASFTRKDALWGRLAVAKPKGVILFWKVAAVFFGILLLGGVFAATTLHNRLNEKYGILETRNKELGLLVDSLKNSHPKIITEIQIVEKEKVIIKKVEVLKFVDQKERDGITTVNNENEQLKNRILQLEELLVLANDSLKWVQTEQIKTPVSRDEKPEQQKANFKLKTEKVKDQMKTDLVQKTPELKLQFFKSKEDGVQFDVSSTLMKR